jgi:hypothetical protein
MREKEIKLPGNIDYVISNDKREITLKINHSEHNMQQDDSAFESWCLLLKADRMDCTITLSFKQIDWPYEFINLTPEQCHYMRFLYRVQKFNAQMDWFRISQDNQTEMNRFHEVFSKAIKTNNIPNSYAAYNQDKGLEHAIEKVFTKIPDSLKEIDGLQIDFSIYDQLPNGLFEEKVCERNRIFNTGYFDLWGINNDCELCIFELKEPRNTSAGILSELYFYSNLANDLVHNKNGFKLNTSGKKIYRGSDKIVHTTIKGIRAYFLTNKLHSEILRNIENVLSLLNTNSEISFEFLHYQYNPAKWEREYFSKLSNEFVQRSVAQIIV